MTDTSMVMLDRKPAQPAEQAERIPRDRIRAQQQCRDYWVRAYGSQAEFASRGGVTWVG